MSERHADTTGARGSVLDAAIDRAVRRMVQLDPVAGLPRRVEARLTTAPVRISASRFRYIAAAAAVALVFVAVGLRREDRPEPRTAPGLGQLAGAPRAMSPSGALPQPPEVRLPAASQHATRRQSIPGARRAPHADVIPMPNIHNVFGDRADTVAGATLLAREGIGAPRVVESMPATAPIAISDLSVPPLQVEPLRIVPIPGPPR